MRLFDILFIALLAFVIYGMADPAGAADLLDDLIIEIRALGHGYT